MLISVRVKPLAREEKVERMGDLYKVYVKEPPLRNLANRAVIRLLSTHFHVSQSAIRIVQGARSGRKFIEIQT